jgi:DDE domain
MYRWHNAALSHRHGLFRRARGRENTRHPCTVVSDRLTSCPGALREMKREGELWRFARHRRGRWFNNRVEQDHRRVKRRTGPMLGFQGFWTARRTLAGIATMAMLGKGQVRAVPANDLPAQRAFVHGSSALSPDRKRVGWGSAPPSGRDRPPDGHVFRLTGDRRRSSLSDANRAFLGEVAQWPKAEAGQGG